MQDAEQRCRDRGLTGDAFDECVAEETAAEQQGATEPAPEEVRRTQDSGSGSGGEQTLEQTQSGDGIQQDEQQSDPSGSVVQNAVVNGRRQGRRARSSRRCKDLTPRQLERRARCANRVRRKASKEESIPATVAAAQTGLGVTLGAAA